MKLHLTDVRYHGLHQWPGVNDRSMLPGVHAPLSKSENAMYAAILMLGIPAVVGATVFAVRHLYDGLLWLLPS